MVKCEGYKEVKRNQFQVVTHLTLVQRLLLVGFIFYISFSIFALFHVKMRF